MNTDAYYLLTVVTTITGKKYVAESNGPVRFDSFAAAKEYIAVAQAKRGHWDNDGFNRSVEYVVRYGTPGKSWDVSEYVCTFTFDDTERYYFGASDGFRLTGSCGCMSDKDHSRNKRDALCI